MVNATNALRWLTLLAIVLIAGCATAYHSYSGCFVDCRYCAPPPLPYVHYEGCVCHSCAASMHLPMQSKAADEDAAEPQVSLER